MEEGPLQIRGFQDGTPPGRLQARGLCLIGEFLPCVHCIAFPLLQTERDVPRRPRNWEYPPANNEHRRAVKWFRMDIRDHAMHPPYEGNHYIYVHACTFVVRIIIRSYTANKFRSGHREEVKGNT